MNTSLQHNSPDLGRCWKWGGCPSAELGQKATSASQLWNIPVNTLCVYNASQCYTVVHSWNISDFSHLFGVSTLQLSVVMCNYNIYDPSPGGFSAARFHQKRFLCTTWIYTTWNPRCVCVLPCQKTKWKAILIGNPWPSSYFLSIMKVWSHA